MGSSKKKVTWSCTEYFTFWCGLLGGLMALGQALPMVPWRYMAINTKFGPRWGVDRRMSLFTITDKYGQPQSWLAMQRKTCLAVANMAQPNLMATFSSIVVAASGQGVGPMVGCTGWEVCQRHATERCGRYRELAYIGIASFFMHFIGAMSAFLSCVTIMQEGYIPKKKAEKKLQAAWQTVIAALVASVLVTTGSLMWTLASEFIIKGLQNTGYYPFARAYIGIYMSYVTMSLLFLALLFSLCRYRGRVTESTAENQYAEAPIVDWGQADPMFAAGVDGEGVVGIDDGMLYDAMGNPIGMDDMGMDDMDPLLMGGAPPPNI